MTDKPKMIRRIAKEVLLFFTALGLVGLVWCFLTVRNLYFEHKETNLKNEIATLSSRLDTLPTDRIKEIYDGLSINFVVNYQVKDDSYAIPKREEQDFLKDFPNAKKLPTYPNGFSYLKNEAWKKDGHYILVDDVKYWRPPMHDILVATGKPLDSTVVFDYVDLEKFRNYFKSETYRDNFFSFIYWEKDIVKYDYDLGTREAFEATMQDGLKFNKDIETERTQLVNSKSLAEQEIQKAKTSSLCNGEMNNILLTTILIIGIILYPSRLCYFLILWAIKTVKRKEE